MSIGAAFRIAIVAIASGITACAPSHSTAASAATETNMPDTPPSPPQADRPPPPRIAPVVKDGVRYQPKFGGSSDPQVGGLLAACDAKSDKELWTLVVYENKRRPDLEGDVQDIFFKSMKFETDGRLVIVNEIGRRYAVDVQAKTSTLLP
jgi:hypothetical protein